MGILKPENYKAPFFDQDREAVRLRQEEFKILYSDMSYLISDEYPGSSIEIINAFITNIALRVKTFVYSNNTPKEYANNYTIYAHLNECMTIFLKKCEESKKQGIDIGYNISPEQLEAFSHLLTASKNGMAYYKRIWLLNELVYNARFGNNGDYSPEPSAQMNNGWFYMLCELFSAETFINHVISKIDELIAKHPEKYHCKAQILSNIGSMLMNQNYSYQENFDIRPIILSTFSFKAVKEFLPYSVSNETVIKIDTNIFLSPVIACLVKTFASTLGISQISAEDLELFQKTFAYESKDKQKMLASAIKFMAQKSYANFKNQNQHLSDEDKLEKVTEVMHRMAELLEEVNPELSQGLILLSSNNIQEDNAKMRP